MSEIVPEDQVMNESIPVRRDSLEQGFMFKKHPTNKVYVTDEASVCSERGSQASSLVAAPPVVDTMSTETLPLLSQPSMRFTMSTVDLKLTDAVTVPSFK
eukprot:gene3893-4980_t